MNFHRHGGLARQSRGVAVQGDLLYVSQSGEESPPQPWGFLDMEEALRSGGLRPTASAPLISPQIRVGSSDEQRSGFDDHNIPEDH
ncbi:MAG TPA: hypothetical protein PKA37_04060 [Planctomycetota bacterium]|nr:hypothetical protein [Planctomycetota bacterium]